MKAKPCDPTDSEWQIGVAVDAASGDHPELTNVETVCTRGAGSAGAIRSPRGDTVSPAIGRSGASQMSYTV